MAAPMASTGRACPPRFSTPRNPDRPTLGPALAKISAALGQPFMPWQQHVADVAMEIDPSTGLLVYRFVGLTVPRQSGKTTLDLAGVIHRALGMGRPQKTTYTAQTGKDARMKWRQDQLPIVRRSPFGKLMTPRLSNGDEGFQWHNGSNHVVIPPTDDGGHGTTLGRATIDEAFAHQTDAPEKGVKPAMVTVEDAQIWRMSTAGDTPYTSPYLWSIVKGGRELVESGRTDGNSCYFEWSASDDADPESPSTWYDTMPALGYTISERTIRSELEDAKRDPEVGLAGFERAYLNRWQHVGQKEWAIISAARWAMSQRPHETWTPTVVGVDLSPDRSRTSIGISDRQWVDVADNRESGPWLTDRLVELRLAHGVNRCALDRGAAAWSLGDEIEAAGYTVTPLGTAEAKVACGQFVDAVRDGTLWHNGRPVLSDAVKGAIKRDVGDAWLLDRRSADVDITPFVAVTNAFWLAGQPVESTDDAPFFAAWR